jgi:hypothetical protein
MSRIILLNEIITISRKDLKYCHVPKKGKPILENYPAKKIFGRVNSMDRRGIEMSLMIPMLENETIVGTMDTGVQIIIPTKKVDRILDKFYGTDFGTAASLPEEIHIPTQKTLVSVKVHRPGEVNMKFTPTLTTNIAAVAEQIKKGNEASRVTIFGDIGSGKTSLAETLFSAIGIPYIIVNQYWWAAMPFEDLISGLNFLADVGAERKLGIMLDNLDELVASTLVSDAGGQGTSSSQTATLLFHLSRIFRLFPGTIISTTSSGEGLGHLNAQTQYFFSLSLSETERASFWEMICPTASKMKEEIARENLPISIMCALLKQAKAIGSLHKRKNPSDEDVRCALQCCGKKEDGQQTGFINAHFHPDDQVKQIKRKED